MPEISRFFGIVIQMYFDDHQPPHFHARYGRYRLEFRFLSDEARGVFPPRALRLVRAWARRHEVELVANWNSIRAGGEGHSIEPLE